MLAHMGLLKQVGKVFPLQEENEVGRLNPDQGHRLKAGGARIKVKSGDSRPRAPALAPGFQKP